MFVLSRKLYWTELHSDNKYRIMQSETNGSNVEPFFRNNSQIKYNTTDNATMCNCTASVDKSFAIDHSDFSKNPTLVFMNANSGNIISSDKNGCLCNIIVYRELINKYHPIESLKSDFNALYWTTAPAALHLLKKQNLRIETVEHVRAHNIAVFGSHMQPYPPEKCLAPLQHKNSIVSILKASARSLTLQLPILSVAAECANVSIAKTEYRVYYKQYTDKDTLKCNQYTHKLTTFDNTIVVNMLRPFHKYVFCVVATNYYSLLVNDDLLPEHGILLQTSAGSKYMHRNIITLDSQD